MSATTVTVTTQGIKPRHVEATRATSRALVIATLSLLVLMGFGLRAYQLSAEGLSEDEFNKLNAVADYRAHGLTSANGEHPFLMKALLTVSVVVAEKWNESALASGHPQLRVAAETALRLPGVLFGALTALLIFLLVVELFGPTTALMAAALWTLDPAAIAFNRIAKEDTFLLFFFLLANVFWLRGQRAAEAGAPNPQRYYWATFAAYGAMLASKYLPHLLAVSVCYYHLFQAIPRTRWRIGQPRYLYLLIFMGLVFVALSPTILLPSTWHEMRVFAGEHRIGHDSYEFMGRLYPNQMSLWLRGVPWYFYYAFIAFKLPLTVVAGALVGLPLLFRRRLGDGRYFLLFWLFFWFFPFSLLGGKFLRYFTVALPAVLITTALGFQTLARLWAQSLTRLGASVPLRHYATMGLLLALLGCSAYASVSAWPHYRLYTNALGGGAAQAGSYFPHDEFYDASMRDTANAIAASARPQARVASETPELFTHYAYAAGRTDLVAVSLSDRAALGEFKAGDIIIVARGRRYFSNDALLTKLAAAQPAAVVNVGDIPAARIYVLDDAMLRRLAPLLQP